jgi:hypothetical protein
MLVHRTHLGDNISRLEAIMLRGVKSASLLHMEHDISRGKLAISSDFPKSSSFSYLLTSGY